MAKSFDHRKIIAVCASWEDVENLNLVLSHLIEAAESRAFLPLCVAFDRSGSCAVFGQTEPQISAEIS